MGGGRYGIEGCVCRAAVLLDGTLLVFPKGLPLMGKESIHCINIQYLRCGVWCQGTRRSRTRFRECTQLWSEWGLSPSALLIQFSHLPFPVLLLELIFVRELWNVSWFHLAPPLMGSADERMGVFGLCPAEHLPWKMRQVGNAFLWDCTAEHC